MVATLDPVAKPKKPPTETVRITKELVRRINRIAAHRDRSVPDYLSELLGPIIDRQEAQMIDEVAKERKQHKA